MHTLQNKVVFILIIPAQTLGIKLLVSDRWTLWRWMVYGLFGLQEDSDREGERRASEDCEVSEAELATRRLDIVHDTLNVQHASI